MGKTPWDSNLHVYSRRRLDTLAYAPRWLVWCFLSCYGRAIYVKKSLNSRIKSDKTNVGSFSHGPSFRSSEY